MQPRRQQRQPSPHEVPGPRAAHEALGRVRQQGRRRRLPALQAHVHLSLTDYGRRSFRARFGFVSNLKTKMQAEKVDKTWRLLVKKVTRAGAMAALANREVPEMVRKSWAKYSRGRGCRATRFR